MEAEPPEILAVALFRFSASITPSKERCAVIIAAFRRSGTQRNALEEGLRGLLTTLPALFPRGSGGGFRFGLALGFTLGGSLALGRLALRSFALRSFALGRLALCRFTLGWRLALGRFTLRRLTLRGLALRRLALGRPLRGLLGRFSLSFTFDRHGLTSE